MAAASNSTGTLCKKFTGENSPTDNVKNPIDHFPSLFCRKKNDSTLANITRPIIKPSLFKTHLNPMGTDCEVIHATVVSSTRPNMVAV